MCPRLPMATGLPEDTTCCPGCINASSGMPRHPSGIRRWTTTRRPGCHRFYPFLSSYFSPIPMSKRNASLWAFSAKITGSAIGPDGIRAFSWVEQERDAPTNVWQDVIGGRYGEAATGGSFSPAYERNGQDCAANTVVELRFMGSLGAVDAYEFDLPGGAAGGGGGGTPGLITVQDSPVAGPTTPASSPITNVSTLQAHSVTGLIVAAGLAGIAEIGNRDASLTQTGVVNTIAQTFGGDKTFDHRVIVGPDAGATGTARLMLYALNTGANSVPLWFGDASTASGISMQKIVSAGGVGQLETVFPGIFTGRLLLTGDGPVARPSLVLSAGAAAPSIRLTVGGVSSSPPSQIVMDPAYAGQAGTGGGGDSFRGGVCVGLGTGGSSGIIINTTSITGGSAGNILYQGAGVVASLALAPYLTTTGATLTVLDNLLPGAKVQDATITPA